MRQILVATDGSESGDRAVDVAADLAKAMEGTLHILNVGGDLPSEALKELRRSPSMEKLVGEAIDAHAQHILKHALELAKRDGVLDIKTHRSWGDVAEKIIELAERVGADTLVVGRRGRGRLTGLLLGSVSQKVATLAPCKVLVVP